MRLTKKLATLAIRLNVSASSRSGGQTFDVSVCDLLVDVARKKKGYVTLMPSLMSWRMAWMPSGVAGTFTMRFSRPTVFQSRRASCRVPVVSLASNGRLRG